MSENTERAAELLERAGKALEADRSQALALQAQAFIQLEQLERLTKIEDHLEWVKECLRSIDTQMAGLQQS